MGLKKETERSLDIRKRETNLKKKSSPSINSNNQRQPVNQPTNQATKFKNRSMNKLKNQVAVQTEKYQEELEKSDDGVKSGTQLVEKGYKTSKATIKGVRKVSSNINQRRKFKKAEEKLSEINTNNNLKTSIENQDIKKSSNINQKRKFKKSEEKLSEININNNLKTSTENQDIKKSSNINQKRKFKKSEEKLSEINTNNNLKTSTENQDIKKSSNSKLTQRRKTRKLKRSDDEQLRKTKAKISGANTKNNFNTPKKKETFIRKSMRQPKKLTKKGVKKSILKGASSYKESLTQDDDGVKVGVEGSKIAGKLVKKGTKTIIHVGKIQGKGISKATNKLREVGTRLQAKQAIRTARATKGIKTKQRRILRKRFTRRNVKEAQKARPIRAFSKNIGRTFRKGFNTVRRIGVAQLKRLTGAKVLAGVGAIGIKLMPIFLVLGLLLSVVFVIMGAGGNESNNQNFGGIHTLSPQVEQWRSLVTEIAEEKNMSDYVDLVLAIIQTETGGVGTTDIMQSSESAGYPPNYFQTERESVEQGISYLKQIVTLLTGYSDDYANDYKLIAQSYNFGIGFSTYTNAQDVGGYDLEIAEKYSRDVVAYSLGNTTGETYPYENDLSLRLGKPYLYRNGGNFMYGEMIGQYVVTYADGQIAPPVIPVIVTSHFGNRSSPGGIGSTNHKGIDLACQGGVTPINSLFAGEVVTSEYRGGLGNTVVVKHSSDFYSTYAHMSSLEVSVGDAVNAGDTLGICGSTGNSTGPHLHLELSPEPHQYQIDPYPYIQHFEGR